MPCGKFRTRFYGASPGRYTIDFKRSRASRYARRWVDLIHHLDEQERKRLEAEPLKSVTFERRKGEPT